MRVARVHGPHDLRLHDEPLPTPGPGEALVRVTAVGICGSDLHWLAEGGIGADRITTPFVLGHECAGVIESGARAGQHVAIDPAITCGHCEYCERGLANLCQRLRFAGHTPTDGAMQEFLAWPERFLVPLPDSLSDAEGALLEPLGVAMYAVELGGVRPGMSVAVAGCGPIGLCLLDVAREAGATLLLATELPGLPHRAGAAEARGATVFAGGDGHEVDELLEATGGRGVDVAFEAAGDPEAVDAAVAAVKPGGRVVIVGIPCEDRISFTASVARRKDLRLHIAHRMMHTYPGAIALVRSGRVHVADLVSHRFPLERIGDAFEVGHRREGLKVLIEP
ncbi:MAG TPA: alcohol dehydrogenase catalytic domain-containing protein [Longimicrobiales bacterium]